MPSAANAKSEKPASSEATDNSPIRQIMTILDHKIRNLEKRKSKLTSYRDLQKAGKELNGDQRVAVAKYDEVAQTLEFARDLAKQVASIATVTEREAKKQAKKDAWLKYASETGKIREVLLILDCLTQMGCSEARDDFLNGTNGACKLTEADLKLLDDLYPEVTPKHDPTEEGQPGFHMYMTKAAEHLYAIIDGKPKDVLGTTYAHLKGIITAVHECGYFDKGAESAAPEGEPGAAPRAEAAPDAAPGPPPPAALPLPPAPGVVPAPAYPLRQLPPITLQEVEHAYFAQQYPQPRPISEVIGSQNFFFLQESEIDSPVGTPQPPPMMSQASPSQIPSQTFTNQHFVQLPGGRAPEPAALPLPPQPLFQPQPELAAFPAPPLAAAPQPTPSDERKSQSPVEIKKDDEWKETASPEREETGDRKTHGQGDGQGRFRRYGRGSRGAPNGFRPRGAFQSRQGGDPHGRHGDYQSRGKDGFQSRQYNDNYQSRHGKDGYQSRGNDGYYGNGDADGHQQNENGGRDRDRYNDNGQNYQGGYKGRGRGGPRGAPRGSSRPPRSQHYTRKSENVE